MGWAPLGAADRDRVSAEVGIPASGRAAEMVKLDVAEVLVLFPRARCAQERRHVAPLRFESAVRRVSQ